MHVVLPGVRFSEDSADDVQKQKQLLKDAAAFLVSCQIPSLVSGTDPPTDPGHLGVNSMVVDLSHARVRIFLSRLKTAWITALCPWMEPR